MKKYKLELENWEFSYNKMFGTNPNVGVVNPTFGKTATVRAPSGSKENISGIGGRSAPKGKW